MSTNKSKRPIEYKIPEKQTMSNVSVSMESKPDGEGIQHINLGVTITRGHQHEQTEQHDQTISDKELETMSTNNANNINDLTEYGEFMPTEPTVGIITDEPQVIPVAEVIEEAKDLKGTKSKQ